LYESGSDLPLIPASTLKLLTGTAAVERLGADARLRTSVRVDGQPEDGVVSDLWFVGGGDPVLGTADWVASFDHQPVLVTPLETLADAVVAAGITEVEGSLLGDDSRYDGVRAVPTWPARYSTSGSIGPLSALTVNDGYARFGIGAEPFADPAAGAAEVLAGLLRARGVVVGGTGTGVAPEGTSEVAGIDSPTVGKLVAGMVLESDNGTAELLTKELGLRVSGEASTAAGTSAVLGLAAERGLPTEGSFLVDGSGLDLGNRLTCELLGELLVGSEPGGPLDDGLAVAAVTGTLAERFVGTALAGRVRAKTGSLLAVASLAGFAQTATGTDLTFAYVLNGIDATEASVGLQRRLGELLVAHPDTDLAALGPAGAVASPE
nr:D-alanyl-D-alanine carboxypeptidase [Acidimicrobiia bacterium]